MKRFATVRRGGSSRGRAALPLLVLLAVAALAGCRAEPAGESTSAGSEEAPLTAEQQRIKAQLEAIGYAASTQPAPEARGVTVHVPEATSPGLNLFTSGHGPVAALVDMEGRLVHGWRYTFDRIWPDAQPPRVGKGSEKWRYAHLFPNGDLLAIFDGSGLIRLDWDSNLLWASEIAAHHDLEVLPDGDIWVLTRTAHMIPRINPDQPVMEDFVYVLSPDGEVKERFSLLEVFERSDLEPEIAERLPTTGSLLYANTLEVFDGSQADLSPLFARGNILTAFNRIDVIAIIDGTSREIVWAMTDDWLGIHYPTLVADGKILFYANGMRMNFSQVHIVDPLTREYVWTYEAEPPTALYSPACGSAQQLVNGNVLITESEDGRIIEVTPGGRIVWEYLNTFEMPRHPDRIPYVYFLTRYDPGFLQRPGR